MWKENLVDLVTRSRDDRVLLERDGLQFGPQKIEVRRRQCCEKAITDCAW